jgi:hypothetical protein
MYVARPLSMYRTYPSALSLSPPEGPNSGILVIQDDETEPTCCFGLVKSTDYIGAQPFPQNKDLEVLFPDGDFTECTRVLFIPVLNQPLSSKQYYVIQRKWKHKGYVSHLNLHFLFYPPFSFGPNWLLYYQFVLLVMLTK